MDIYRPLCRSEIGIMVGMVSLLLTNLADDPNISIASQFCIMMTFTGPKNTDRNHRNTTTYRWSMSCSLQP